MSKWASPTAFRKPEVAFCLNLRPLTLGHLMLIDDLGIDLGTNSLGDLVVIAVVCSRSHAKSRRFIGTFRARLVVAALTYIAGRRRNLDKQVATINEWLRDNIEGPKVLRVGGLGGSSEDSASPLHFNLLSCAIGKLGMSMKEAMDCPVKTLRQLLAALGEATGEMKLESRRAERLRDMARQFEQQEQASRN